MVLEGKSTSTCIFGLGIWHPEPTPRSSVRNARIFVVKEVESVELVVAVASVWLVGRFDPGAPMEKTGH